MKKVLLFAIIVLCVCGFKFTASAKIIMPTPDQTFSPYCEELGGNGSYVSNYDKDEHNLEGYYLYLMPRQVLMLDKVLGSPVSCTKGEVFNVSYTKTTSYGYEAAKTFAKSYQESRKSSISFKFGDEIFKAGSNYEHSISNVFSSQITTTYKESCSVETSITKNYTAWETGVYQAYLQSLYNVYIIQEYKTMYDENNFPYKVQTGKNDIYLAPYFKNSINYIDMTCSNLDGISTSVNFVDNPLIIQKK